MKASKIITLGLVAASAGLIMGTVALPAQAASMDRVVNAQRPNRPDSGKHGNFWARNHLHRQIKITESAPGVYKVTVRDNGKSATLTVLVGAGFRISVTPTFGPAPVAIAPRATPHVSPRVRL